MPTRSRGTTRWPSRAPAASRTSQERSRWRRWKARMRRAASTRSRRTAAGSARYAAASASGGTRRRRGVRTTPSSRRVNAKSARSPCRRTAATIRRTRRSIASPGSPAGPPSARAARPRPPPPRGARLAGRAARGRATFPRRRRSPPRTSRGLAHDLRAERAQLLLEALVTAVEVVDARDARRALGGEPGEHEAHARAEIGRHHGRTREPRRPAHERAVALHAHLRAHAGELLDVHEAVLEDRFGEAARPVGPRHERHELRLQVGGKARVGHGGDVDRAERPVALDGKPALALVHAHAGLAQ